MFWNEPTDERGRHARAASYALLSFVLALGGYLFLGLDRGQTAAYAVLAYAMLNALNYRAFFGARERGPKRNLKG